MINLYEILVPTLYGDNNRPIKTKHHRSWDKEVIKIAGGMTIMHPAKAGKWLSTKSNDLIEEKVIPVRVACTRIQLDSILIFTKRHYRQQEVMAYKLSEEVILV